MAGVILPGDHLMTKLGDGRGPRFLTRTTSAMSASLSYAWRTLGSSAMRMVTPRALLPSAQQ